MCIRDSCADCPWTSSAAANKVAGAAATASPATTLRLVTGVISLAGATELGKFELDDCMGTSFVTAVRPCRAAERFDAAERQRFRKSIDAYINGNPLRDARFESL